MVCPTRTDPICRHFEYKFPTVNRDRPAMICKRWRMEYI